MNDSVEGSSGGPYKRTLQQLVRRNVKHGFPMESIGRDLVDEVEEDVGEELSTTELPELKKHEDTSFKTVDKMEDVLAKRRTSVLSFLTYFTGLVAAAGGINIWYSGRCLDVFYTSMVCFGVIIAYAVVFIITVLGIHAGARQWNFLMKQKIYSDEDMDAYVDRVMEGRILKKDVQERLDFASVREYGAQYRMWEWLLLVAFLFAFGVALIIMVGLDMVGYIHDQPRFCTHG